MRGSELGPSPPKPTPARPTVWRPPALPTLLAAGLALITLGVLVATLSMRGASVEHEAWVQGVPYAPCLQQETSEYYRTLTPALEALFTGSFRKTELEASCLGCEVLDYRCGGLGGPEGSRGSGGPQGSRES
ncbi:transmembrane protease serine 9-like [Erinaceus europaeus]|uniref:Transmembrane protease serine 9-like n=1 Tax=Erinaceus europaeus TaxID=9365 RepID=A0ABM3WN98_ERIEU|nr:transmembrane protease serine 9-like [Erinaceus europaeus]